MDCPTNIYIPGCVSQHRVADGQPRWEEDYYSAGAVLLADCFSNGGGEGGFELPYFAQVADSQAKWSQTRVNKGFLHFLPFLLFP